MPKYSALIPIGITVMATTKTPAKKAKKQAQAVTYTDKSGVEKTLPVSQVKSYEDTEYFADTSEIFPQLEQACFAKSGEAFDAEGRPNLLGMNIIVREVVQMTVGPFPDPYYAMHVIVPVTDNTPNGEYSVLSRGTTVAETIEQLSGIDLATGRRVAPGELPVMLRVEFAAGAGAFEGYYYVAKPEQEEVTVEG